MVQKKTEETPASEKTEKIGKTAKKKRFPKSLKIVLIAIAAIVALLGILFAILFSSADEVRRTSDEFVVVLKSGDSEKIYDAISPVFKRATTHDEWNQLFDIVRPLLISDNYEQSGFSVQKTAGIGDTAVVNYTVHTVDYGDIQVDISLMKNDGVWEVIGMNIPNIPLELINPRSNSE